MHSTLRRASLVFVVCIACILEASSASKTYDGYTFVFCGKKAWLYDMDKSIVNTWNCTYSIQACADLLRDSSILVSAATGGVMGKTSFSGGGGGTVPLSFKRLQIINWKGEVTWDYQFTSSEYTPHHDIEPVYRTNDPNEQPTVLVVCSTSWGDKIIEIRPTGKTTGEIIWEWKASDHACESNCSGKVTVLDKSKGGTATGWGMNNTTDAMHTNLVSFNPRLDQLVISAKAFNEFLVIDHSTTTAEAIGTTGGTSGKGGQILYRWGSPKNYGVTEDKQLNGQHHCCWVPDTMLGTTDTIPGRGNFMVVNNNGGRNGTVMEIMCPGAKDGVYPYTEGQAFEPKSPLWQYKPEGLESNEGSIQKLPNGNYIISTGGVNMSGGFGKTALGGMGSDIRKVYEVNSSGSVVWELDLEDEQIDGNSTEAYRYAYGYLKGAGTRVHRYASTASALPTVKIIPTASGGRVLLTTTIQCDNARCALYEINGKEIIHTAPATAEGSWNLGTIPCGTYVVRITADNHQITDRISVHR